MTPCPRRAVAGRWLLAAVFTAAAAAAAQVPAADAPAPPAIQVNDGGLSLTPVAEYRSDTLQPQLGNGVIADPQLWPASLVARMPGEICTATLVGPRTLLTAAHCVGDGAIVSIAFDKGKTTVKGKCQRAPHWSIVEPSKDLALCLLDELLKRAGLFYERVSLDPTPVAPGRQLVAGGFGCQDLNKRTMENPPVFRIGSVFVDRGPTPDALWSDWIITSAATDATKAFICPGDSGGAVYWSRADRSRLIVAVASGVQADASRTDYKVSYLAALSTADAIAFIEGWRKQLGHEICGLSPSVDDCRPAQV